MKAVVLMIAITLLPVAARAQIVPVPNAPPWMPRPIDSSSDMRSGGILIAAVGGGLLLGGFGYMIGEKANDLSYGLFSDHQPDPNFAPITIGLIVSGAAVGAIGTTLIVFGQKRMKRARLLRASAAR
jgi:hypothetical protein